MPSKQPTTRKTDPQAPGRGAHTPVRHARRGGGPAPRSCSHLGAHGQPAVLTLRCSGGTASSPGASPGRLTGATMGRTDTRRVLTDSTAGQRPHPVRVRGALLLSVIPGRGGAAVRAGHEHANAIGAAAPRRGAGRRGMGAVDDRRGCGYPPCVSSCEKGEQGDHSTLLAHPFLPLLSDPSTGGANPRRARCSWKRSSVSRGSSRRRVATRHERAACPAIARTAAPLSLPAYPLPERAGAAVLASTTPAPRV